MAKKKTKSKARRRRKNPDLSQIDGRAALALALVGIGIGGTSAAIAGKHNLPGRTTIGAAIGGVLGMIMGAFLPKGQASTRRLIALFETEKVFYELAYELNNRPDWVAIPMRGISKLLVGDASIVLARGSHGQ